MRITAEQALQRIQGTGMRKAKGAQMTLLRSIKQTRRDRVFLFDRGGSTVVSPADSELPAVLAEYPTSDSTPPALNNWLVELAKEVKWYQEKGRKAVPKVLKAPTKVQAAAEPIMIEPLLGDISWGQGTPYNMYLKFVNPSTNKTQTCITGCVATAMAMVMYYWYKQGRKRGCRATPAYTTTKNKYSIAAMDNIELFGWENMTDKKPTTTVSKAAVAKLMEYMGKIVYMDYSPSWSGAKISKVAPALKNYLNVPTAERVELRYVTTPRFKARLISELQQGRPVIMAGGTSSIDGSHCFVCDGYDSSTDMFHFNWGWDGHCDGWYLLTALVTDNGDYTTKKNMVAGICPPILGDVNNDGKINMADVSKAISIKNKGEYDIAADVNFDGKVDSEDTNKIINTILGKEKL